VEEAWDFNVEHDAIFKWPQDIEADLLVTQSGVVGALLAPWAPFLVTIDVGGLALGDQTILRFTGLLLGLQAVHQIDSFLV
jgi:hypothetical protein